MGFQGDSENIALGKSASNSPGACLPEEEDLHPISFVAIDARLIFRLPPAGDLQEKGK